jgi:alpha-L-fucosidase
VTYTAEDIRFTSKGNVLYATCLGWPKKTFTIGSLGRWSRTPFGGPDPAFYADEIRSIRMLGVDRNLKWKVSKKGLTITRPDVKPCDHAFVFKITRRG